MEGSGWEELQMEARTEEGEESGTESRWAREVEVEEGGVTGSKERGGV